MPILASVIIAVLLAGFFAWLIQFLPVAEPFPTIARGLIIFAVVVYVVGIIFGFAAPLPLSLHR